MSEMKVLDLGDVLVETKANLTKNFDGANSQNTLNL